VSAWAEVTAGVRVRTSRCYAMNSLVAESDGHALVVDAGVLPSELDDIAAVVHGIAPRFERVALAFTHPHWDHVLGAPWFPGATTFAHAGFADQLEHDLAHVIARTAEGLAAKGEKLPHPFRAFRPRLTARGTTRVELGPFEVVTYDTPGHSGCHLALWLPSPGVLVAGDLLSDIEIPWLDGPPWVYRSSLKSLHWLFEQEDVRVLVPGHGPVAHGRADGYRRLLRDMNYLLQLEERVGAAKKKGLSLDETRAELADMSYLGKDAGNDEIAMNDVHAENVGFAYAALADSTTPGRS
jgi:glyoxylase-like metal-dependent hydrolase (beta-lactamase superfamily II)